MADFIEAEEVVRKFFPKGTTFDYEGEEYMVIDSGKPLPQKGKGEPKTDIYVCAQSEGTTKEFKISYKKKNADFLENKMKSDRAEQIFGANWKEIIEENTKRISDRFEETPVLFLDQRKKTEPGSMTLGWRFELFNKLQGGLSGKMENMTRDQVYEVYAGKKLEERKRNAKVNGKVIPNSGTADYILVTDEVESAQDIINRMQPIGEYIDENPDIYFGCKALNYRSKKKKMEGNRALSVQVDWHVEDKKLSIDIEYEKPLMRDGKQMKAAVQTCLKLLQKKDATEFDSKELEDIPVYKKDSTE
ncbi:hypothetical protein [Roseburia sp. 499]|uniref:hypothetical protein n=1 Tax=Roseburia sp. 499 TaxID=1261634 RepID=UPI000952B7F5|nr:hypothetical protein [Roseburia sp. 499]WVK69890.1 hypothetical protein BIV20_16365 [Roseburia sp. 499]